MNNQKLTDVGQVFKTRTTQGVTLSDLAPAARAATFCAVASLLVDFDAIITGTIDE